MNVAILAHHNASGKVLPHVLRYVEALAGCFQHVIVVSNGCLSEEAQHALEKFADVRLRPNVGYDFGAWRDTLKVESRLIEKADELLLTNDSIVGPFYPMAEVLERVRALNADFGGVTESFEHVWHIQSFFLLLRPQLFLSAPFRRFFDIVLDLEDKKQVIYSYELGFSSWMRQHGFAGVPLVPQRDLEAHIDLPLGRTNPWGQPNGLFDLGAPFCKTSILPGIFKSSKESDAPLHKRTKITPLHRVLKEMPYSILEPFHVEPTET